MDEPIQKQFGAVGWNLGVVFLSFSCGSPSLPTLAIWFHLRDKLSKLGAAVSPARRLRAPDWLKV